MTSSIKEDEYEEGRERESSALSKDRIVEYLRGKSPRRLLTFQGSWMARKLFDYLPKKKDNPFLSQKGGVGRTCAIECSNAPGG